MATFVLVGLSASCFSLFTPSTSINLLDRKKRRGKREHSVKHTLEDNYTLEKFRHLSQRWRSLTKIQTGQSGLLFAAGLTRRAAVTVGAHIKMQLFLKVSEL